MADGIEMVLRNNATRVDELIPISYPLPATLISYLDGLELRAYIKSTKSPIAYITPPRAEPQAKLAPVMASFSSEGPSEPCLKSLRVYVIVAFTEALGVDGVIPFNKLLGTSMACPHITGVAGLLKTVHPAWSPAEIRSAIMTTARIQDNNGEEITNESLVTASPFGYGSGHIQPNRAMNPGLVYDLTATKYLNFLCYIGYNSHISLLRPYTCPLKSTLLEDLIYPSIIVPNLSQLITRTRRLKNVGEPALIWPLCRA